MRRILALLALATSALLLTPPASAGGPTSVLITEPMVGSATALYYSDPGYADLDAALMAAESLGGEPSGLGDRSVNLTWMAHDVHPWRTQQLYLDAEGGPVVATYDEGGSTAWARVAEGKAVIALVDGLLHSSSAPDAVPAADTPEPVVTERVVTETTWFSLAGWRWGVLGLLLGAGAVLLARGRSRDTEPRAALIDLEPSAPSLPAQR